METTETLESFFYEKVEDALRRKQVAADPDTEHYLVRLLASFAARRVDDTPLALKMLGSLDAEPGVRRKTLREVGDTSLYVSGFFAESFARRLVDVDYYMGMGESAYGELARHANAWGHHDPLEPVFERLSGDFARFVAVLETISQWLMPSAPQDIVRLYDQFCRTGSGFAARRLAELGVSPQRGMIPQ